MASHAEAFHMVVALSRTAEGRVGELAAARDDVDHVEDEVSR